MEIFNDNNPTLILRVHGGACDSIRTYAQIESRREHATDEHVSKKINFFRLLFSFK